MELNLYLRGHKVSLHKTKRGDVKNILLHPVTLCNGMTNLSLYSTATQNTWRRGLALGNATDARILRWRYQHVGIFWRYLTLKFAFSPTPTPDASQWNIGCVGSQRKILALAVYISCFLCRFHLRLVPNANPFSSGIWA